MLNSVQQFTGRAYVSIYFGFAHPKKGRIGASEPCPLSRIYYPIYGKRDKGNGATSLQRVYGAGVHLVDLNATKYSRTAEPVKTCHLLRAERFRRLPLVDICASCTIRANNCKPCM